MKYGVIFLLVFSLSLPAIAGDDPDQAVLAVRQAWDHANFELKGDAREKALQAVVEQATKVAEAYPDRAEALAWQGIALATWAGAKGGLGALSLAKRARDALLKAEHIDPTVLNGSIYTTLGTLYYRVPGWPIGFGDNDKAREYFRRALRFNPDGLDPNYFYGEFLMEQGEYGQAVEVLEHALQAPRRADRPIADKGRREQVRVALQEALHNMPH